MNKGWTGGSPVIWSQLVQMRFTAGPADPDIIKILIVHDSLAGVVQLFSEEKSEIGHPSTP